MAIIPTSGEFVKVPDGSSGGGVFMVHDNDGTLDKTIAEIYELAKHNIVYLSLASSSSIEIYILARVDMGKGGYVARFFTTDSSLANKSYSATGPNEYPTRP
jgi:hypothetical protein